MKSIHDRRERLQKISEKITAHIQLDDPDRKFLAEALYEISKGKDAAIALDVKARRGESTGKKARNSFDRKVLIKALMEDLIHQQSLTMEAAAARLGKDGLGVFQLEEETIKSYYYDN